MPFLQGIEYQDMVGSGTVSYGPDGITARRTFFVDWADADAFVRVMLGYTESIGGVPVRTVGQQYPGFDYLYATTARTEGMGRLLPGEPGVYDRARVFVSYEGMRYGSWNPDEEDPARYLNESYDFGATMVSVKGSHFTYTDDADVTKTLDTPIGVRDPTMVLMLESNMEPVFPRADIMTRIGTLNNATWYGHPREYVMFDGGSARRTLGADGTEGWTLLYRFIAKKQSWNWFFRGPGGIGANHANGWWEVEDVVSGRPPYPLTNFSVLIDA